MMFNEECTKKFMDVYQFEGFASKILLCREGNVSDIDTEIVGEGLTIEQATKDFIRKDTLACVKLMFKTVESTGQVLSIKRILNSDCFRGNLEDIQYEVEKNRRLVDKFVMGRDMLGAFKKNINAIDYDPITSTDINISGTFGTIYGVNIYVDTILQDCLFAVTEARLLGERVISDISYSDNKLTVKGAMYITDPYAISCGVDSIYTKTTLDFNKLNELYNKYLWTGEEVLTDISKNLDDTKQIVEKTNQIHSIYKYSQQGQCKDCGCKAHLVGKGKDGLDYVHCAIRGAIDHIIEDCNSYKNYKGEMK